MFRRRPKQDDVQSFVMPELVTEAGKEAALGEEKSVPLTDIVIKYDGGENDYAIAIGKLPSGKSVVAIRWNGAHGDTLQGALSEVGTPAQAPAETARWFVLPEFLWVPVLEACGALTGNGVNKPRHNP